MSLVESLLSALVRADGDALVIHVGERPYVIAPSGQIELSQQPLTLEAVSRLLDQLLPPEQHRALAGFGAVEHELEGLEEQDERFTVVAARGGHDIWIEVRRHRPARPAGEISQPFRGAEAVDAAWVPTLPADGPRALGDSQPAVVVPMARSTGRIDIPPAASGSPWGAERLLKLAASRGATTLYLAAHTQPAIRGDGEITVLEAEPPLGETEVDALVLQLAPDESRASLLKGTQTQWSREIPDIGRVRATMFRDRRGPGMILEIMPNSVLSVDQLGLSRQIQALCGHLDGLVLVTGPRDSGKSTLVAAFVDVINRTRRDYVITLERQVRFTHENKQSFVSQREVSGGREEMVASVQAALREDPNVLVLEDMRWPDVTALALDAAAAGALIIVEVVAAGTTAGIARLVHQFRHDRQWEIQQALASTLRGAVAQVLLRKQGGGRLAARELLVATPTLGLLVAEGRFPQLRVALESGRREGMVPLNDALAGFVRAGALDAREAYRRAFDPEELLNLLRREGVDTSFAARFA